jgi:hypothetical protein
MTAHSSESSRSFSSTAGHAIALLLAVAVLPACTHYVPVITKTLDCPINEDQLRTCAAPGAIEPELTYGGLLKLAQDDRQNLARCGLQQRDLVDAVRKCNAAIKTHNEEIERSNDEQRKLAK